MTATFSRNVTIEICSNPEWLGASELAEGTCLSAGDLASVYFDAAERSLQKSGLFAAAEITPSRRQRATYHGWNGASWFSGYRSGGVATMSKLSAKRQAAMDAADEAGRNAMTAAVTANAVSPDEAE